MRGRSHGSVSKTKDTGQSGQVTIPHVLQHKHMQVSEWN